MAHFLIAIVITTLLAYPLEAKNLGIFGATSSIEEEDLIHFIQQKLKDFSKENQQAFMQAMRSSVTSNLEKTMEIKEIKKAHAYAISYFDPSISVDRDILNHEKKVVVKKGSSFNPLSIVSLGEDLLFFDATDPLQLAWAKTQASSAKWILIKGQPFKLEEETNRPIYFDQLGVLTKKFGIQEVPARVSQAGLKLKVEVIPVKETLCSN